MFVFRCIGDSLIKMMHNKFIVFCKLILEKFSIFSHFVFS